MAAPAFRQGDKAGLCSQSKYETLRKQDIFTVNDKKKLRPESALNLRKYLIDIKLYTRYNNQKYI